MLADLTHEQYSDWFDYFIQDPWDETRKDNRLAVAALWSVKPYMEEGAEVPGFDGPGYSNSKEEDVGAAWKRIKETEAKHRGQLNRKTSDPPND
jgi:hypothetical protein